MTQTSNVVRDNFVLPPGAEQFPDDIKRDDNQNIVQFRVPKDGAYHGGVLMSRTYDASKKEWRQPREAVFSLSAGISEQFNDAVESHVANFNKTEAMTAGLWIEALNKPADGFDPTSRAQLIRTWVADAIDYDISLEPERESRKERLAEYHARTKTKVTGYDQVAALAKDNPELAAILAAANITLE